MNLPRTCGRNSAWTADGAWDARGAMSATTVGSGTSGDASAAFDGDNSHDESCMAIPRSIANVAGRTPSAVPCSRNRVTVARSSCAAETATLQFGWNDAPRWSDPTRTGALRWGLAVRRAGPDKIP